MNNNFNNALNSAIDKCSKPFDMETFITRDFNNLYPFTTENINGYIDQFDLDNKSLLTVGSSTDQIINSAYYNCKNQTSIDICPYTKYYFYLKKAALLTLKYNEFLIYFSYKNYPIRFLNNKNVFNIESFEQIKGLLKEINEESFLFWNELYKRFLPVDIRTKLFSYDEYKISILREINAYLKDKYAYNEMKDKIIDIEPTFISGDLSKIDINEKYDNIWFSNIGAYYPVEFTKMLIEKFDKNLNINGKMLICYLYDTTKFDITEEEEKSIYNLNLTNKIIGKYIDDFISFYGVSGFNYNKSIKDSILIYKKKKEQ